MFKKITLFLSNKRGVTSIEYGILAAGLAVVIGAVLGEDGVFTQVLADAFSNVAEVIEANTSGGSEGN
ncbi:Flp family type IVb pilin [Vibrio sp. TRT 21S02]|uniref:Flp family type IVb pilin n=1 Tax=unclassified Vibrio TaxID=2614977 RepID=UPI00349F219F